MEMRDRDEAVFGELLALKMMVAVALSVASRDKEDARSALAEALQACKEQIQEGIAASKAELQADELNTSIVSDAALGTVDFVSKAADSLLKSMGH